MGSPCGFYSRAPNFSAEELVEVLHPSPGPHGPTPPAVGGGGSDGGAGRHRPAVCAAPAGLVYRQRRLRNPTLGASDRV